MVFSVAALALLWTVLLVTAPTLQAGGSILGWVVQAGASTVCHQDAGRSLSLNGVPMAVCSRCIGLYAGGVLGLLAAGLTAAWSRPAPRALFFILIAPTVIDAVLPLTGLFGYPGVGNLTRTLISLPAGGICGWFLAVAIGDMMTDRARSPREAE
jgi:uncharacterized membrane protein